MNATALREARLGAHLRPVMVAVLGTLLIACSKSEELTRAVAQEQIDAALREQTGGDRVRLVISDSGAAHRTYHCPFEGCPDRPIPNFRGIGNGWNELIEFERKGLLKFRLRAKTAPHTWDGRALFDVALTDEAFNHSLSSVPDRHGAIVVRLRFLKEVNIQGVGVATDLHGKRVSIVPFRAQYELTPFAPATLAAVDTREAVFAKYDSGWKLESFR